MSGWSRLFGVCALGGSLLFFGVPAAKGERAKSLTPFAFRPLEALMPVEEKQETLVLDACFQAKNWECAECTMIEEKGGGGRAQIRLHIDVDHFGGEKAYPVGWPRTNLRKTDGVPWLEYDFLQFEMMVKTSREDIPKNALAMRFRGTPQFSTEKTFGAQTPLEKEKWITVTFPIAELLRASSLNLYGFYICEKNYNHQDVVDFSFADFRLVRSNGCTIREMECQGVVFQGEETLKVRIVADGRAVGNGVPFALSQNGKLLRQETLPVARGAQTLDMDIAELKLADGDYVLEAFPQNPEKALKVGFKVIGSPWR